MKALIAGALVAALVVGTAAVGMLGMSGLVIAPQPLPAGAGPHPLGTGGPLGGIPPLMLAAYQDAVAACPQLPWTVLAAIGTVESANGTSRLPGVEAGANWAGAEGPMQFEPSTFAAYAEPVPPGGADPPSPYDPLDAAYAAARDLCASGAARGDLRAAVFAYNHSDTYVTRVLGVAATYARAAAGYAPGPSPAAGAAVAWALAQIGTPYLWGGETPGVGFDCSGLVQVAYRAAGVALPRVAEAQFQAGPRLPAGAPLAPGDLVFFGSGGQATHVGLVVGPATMVDAPHTGAAVRLEAFPAAVGDRWGGEVFLGATRPGGV